MHQPVTDHLIATIRADLRRRLRATYGDRLAETVLFGSYARGEAHAESDLDVLVVLRGPVNHFDEANVLSSHTLDILLEYGIVVSPVVIAEDEFLHGDWPLLTNVRDEGVSL